MTHDLETLRALLARVEAATGPDRELDAECECAMMYQHSAAISCSPHTRSGRKGFVKSVYENGRAGVWSTSEYTSSMDAAIALVDRVLPRNDWQFCKSGEGTIIYRTSNYEPLCAGGKGATVPLAILSALLRALISEQGGNDD